jgi:hypothetical protein
MKRIVICAFLMVPISAAAAGLACDTRPAKNTPASALPGLARISKAEAQKRALARLKSQSAEIVSAELEVEEGCLVYSFDIRLSGKPGVEEIMVDAGTGKIVSHKHETAAQEAAERAKDGATAAKKAK